MLSLLDNNKNESISIYILESQISEKKKIYISQICSQFPSSELIWCPTINVKEKLGMEIKTDRGSLSQYSRIFFSNVLPKDVERVLYLDCDIIVNGSILPLWNLDLQGNTIAALKDAFSKFYRKNINLKSNSIMFNSGVMLIDVLKWKENEIEQKVLDFICKKNGNIQQGDQGALNAVLSDKILCFNPQFNAVTIFFDFSYSEILKYRKPVNFYNKEDIEAAVKNPILIHYTTSFLSKRPWVEGSNHYYKDKWLKYKLKSPWSDYPLWKNQTSAGTKIMQLLFKVTFRWFAVSFSGFLQAYCRPFFYKINLKMRG